MFNKVVFGVVVLIGIYLIWQNSKVQPQEVGMEGLTNGDRPAPNWTDVRRAGF